MRPLRQLWEEKPIVLLVILAAVLRVVAAYFSRGYGMHDDHFLVIEPAQAWLDKVDYNGWMPMFKEGTGPSGHSLFYPGIHYVLFLLLKGIGITDPQFKMFIVRLLHAAFSLITVYYSYKITETLSGKKLATQTALLFAAFWFMPFFSVRNLVEMFCVPFLIYGLWLSLKAKKSSCPYRLYLLSGFILGLGFSVRFQTLTFFAGLLLAVLLLQQWRGFLFLCAGYVISILLVQGGIDLFIWGRPFAEFQEYVSYNITHATTYIVNSWYMYLLLVLGAIVPPLSIMLLFGFFRNWKKNLELFLPAVVFFAFHSIFPNKQERFIIPAIPFIIILGMIGWNEYVATNNFWKRNKSLLRGCWIFIWIVNIVLLVPVTVMYSKKARVESMVYLSRYPGIENLLVEESNGRHGTMLPKYYLQQWVEVNEISENRPMEEYLPVLQSGESNSIPRFVLFFDKNDLEQRVKRLETLIPGLVFETEIQPGFLDNLLYKLNPMNSNQTIFIYRNTRFFPEKL